MPAMPRFDHVGITVADLDRVTGFFVDLGLELEGRQVVEGEFLDTVVGIPGCRTEIAMLRPPDGGAGLELSSFERPDHEAGSPDALATVLGLRIVSLEVDDLIGQLDRLAVAGYGLVGGIGEYEHAWRMAHVRGPEGIIVSLAERLTGAAGTPRTDGVTSLRRARAADAPAVAALLIRARTAAAADGAVPPSIHADDAVRDWVATVVLPGHEVWLGIAGADTVVAVMVLDGAGIDQLYVAPERTGRGIGSRLVGHAKRLRPEGLQLWTFVSNGRARRFYERHGFAVAEETDGSGNEERRPDLRLVWPPPGTGATRATR